MQGVVMVVVAAVAEAVGGVLDRPVAFFPAPELLPASSHQLGWSEVSQKRYLDRQKKSSTLPLGYREYQDSFRPSIMV